MVVADIQVRMLGGKFESWREINIPKIVTRHEFEVFENGGKFKFWREIETLIFDALHDFVVENFLAKNAIRKIFPFYNHV